VTSVRSARGGHSASVLTSQWRRQNASRMSPSGAVRQFDGRLRKMSLGWPGWLCCACCAVLHVKSLEVAAAGAT